MVLKNLHDRLFRRLPSGGRLLKSKPMSRIANKILAELEVQERYEECQTLADKIKAIEEGDALRYTELAFDREGLVEIGWVKPGATWQDVHDRALSFFGLASIFEYENGKIGQAVAKRNLRIVKSQAE